MSLTVVVVLAFLTGVSGSPSVTIRPEADLVDMTNSIPDMVEETHVLDQVRIKTVAVFFPKKKINIEHRKKKLQLKTVIFYCSHNYVKTFLYIVQKPMLKSKLSSYYQPQPPSSYRAKGFKVVLKIMIINMFHLGDKTAPTLTTVKFLSSVTVLHINTGRGRGVMLQFKSLKSWEDAALFSS